MKPRISIRPMEVKDVPEVCAIHRAVLLTPTARIGTKFLSHFYKTLVKTPETHCAIVAVSDGQIIGCITATRDSLQTQRLLTPIMYLPSVWREIIRALFGKNVRFSDLIDRLITERAITQYISGSYMSILTFCLDTLYQRRGIGSTLFAALISDFPKDSDLYVDTLAANRNARGWYEAHGFTRVTRIRRSILYRHKIT